MKKLIFVIIFLLTVTTQVSFGQNEKDQVIKTARALETTPLAKDTVKMQEKALMWVIETDQVSITVCGGIFNLFSDAKDKMADSMTGAYTIGMAAFVLENPAKTSDENAVQLAGLETALKTYEAIVKEKPKMKFAAIEKLILKKNAGELAGIVAAADCGKK